MLSENVARRFIFEVFEAVQSLHHNGIVHRFENKIFPKNDFINKYGFYLIFFTFKFNHYSLVKKFPQNVDNRIPIV